ncbi:MAG: hypothetical protein ACLUDH_04800 [Faecalispora sporosphaeroides]|uniref:hypothetical protein n=1 Tax=Faecalispora sporosphaeroides TaxID=1549 RepID=UPI003993A7B4
MKSFEKIVRPLQTKILQCGCPANNWLDKRRVSDHAAGNNRIGPFGWLKMKRERQIMDNNKNRMKDRPKSKPELRKMKPRENADVGMINGKKTGQHDAEFEKTKEGMR